MLDSGNGYSNGVHGNRILDRLAAEDRAVLSAKLSPVFLRVKTVLFEPGEVVDAVYFPLDGVISLVTPLEDGAIVEVATIGNEGLVGVPSIPGGALAVRAISQVAGRCLTMSVEAFRDAASASPAIDQLVQTYVLALFGQISQAAACNRLHTNEERLSRWLLMSHDRGGRRQVHHHSGVSGSDAGVAPSHGHPLGRSTPEGRADPLPPRSRGDHRQARVGERLLRVLPHHQERAG